MVRVTLRLPDDLHCDLPSKSKPTGASLNETILASIRSGLTLPEHQRPEETPLERERRFVREALADISVQRDPGPSTSPTRFNRAWSGS
jgi:hypothetical protein